MSIKSIHSYNTTYIIPTISIYTDRNCRTNKLHYLSVDAWFLKWGISIAFEK